MDRLSWKSLVHDTYVHTHVNVLCACVCVCMCVCMCVCVYVCAVVEGEMTGLSEQIRMGGLRPMLDVGMTPSHVSILQDEDTGSNPLTGEEGGEEGEGEGGEGDGMWHCCPLESVGLGGNQIRDEGAASLASALAKNNSACDSL